MKVRFGFPCRGQADLTLAAFPQLVDDLERLGFDSLWLPEHMLNGPFDPLVGLAHAAARTTRLKLGAYLIVPGRNPVRLAREPAGLAHPAGTFVRWAVPGAGASSRTPGLRLDPWPAHARRGPGETPACRGC